MPDATDQHLSLEGDSLRVTEEYSAARAQFPRISLDDIEAEIEVTHYLNLGHSVALMGLDSDEAEHRVTLCALTLRNRFVVIGKSAPMDPRNFDAEKGRRFAYEDAVRQIWPLMAYAALDRMADPRRPLSPSPSPGRDDDPVHVSLDDELPGDD